MLIRAETAFDPHSSRTNALYVANLECIDADSKNVRLRARIVAVDAVEPARVRIQFYVFLHEASGEIVPATEARVEFITRPSDWSDCEEVLELSAAMPSESTVYAGFVRVLYDGEVCDATFLPFDDLGSKHVASRRSREPAERFMEVFSLIFGAERLASNGFEVEAEDQWRKARQQLYRLRETHPAWNPGLVEKRLEYVSKQDPPLSAHR